MIEKYVKKSFINTFIQVLCDSVFLLIIVSYRLSSKSSPKNSVCIHILYSGYRVLMLFVLRKLHSLISPLPTIFCTVYRILNSLLFLKLNIFILTVSPNFFFQVFPTFSVCVVLNLGSHWSNWLCIISMSPRHYNGLTISWL